MNKTKKMTPRTVKKRVEYWVEVNRKVEIIGTPNIKTYKPSPVFGDFVECEITIQKPIGRKVR